MMKDGKNSLSLNLNLLVEKTKFESLYDNLKLSLFGVLFMLLKNQDFSIWVEVIFVILQLFQLMAFPFNPLVKIKNKKLVYKCMETKRYFQSSLKFFTIFSNSYIFSK